MYSSLKKPKGGGGGGGGGGEEEEEEEEEEGLQLKISETPLLSPRHFLKKSK